MELVELWRQPGGVSCVASRLDGRCALRGLSPEPRDLLAELFQVIDGQLELLEVRLALRELIVFSVEVEVPGKHSLFVGGLDIGPGVGHVFGEEDIMAAGNGEVRCADNTRPVVAHLLLLLHLLLHLGVSQSEALLLVVAGASQEFFATAAISVALLEIWLTELLLTHARCDFIK